eukprot:s1451_g6.t1
MALAQRSGCKAISILPWKFGVAMRLSAFCWMLKAGIPSNLQKPQSVLDGAGMAATSAGAPTPSPNAPGPRPSSEALNSATSGPRPGAGKKWSEVCEQVQKPDGSVRTSPPFKSAATSTGVSPPRLRHPTGWCRRPSRGRTSLCSGIPPKDPSRAGSSRGASSGKSSRSSSRDIARDGDISSRCSSGCWETSTNSSEPVTDIIPSPMESKGLLMPDPIRQRKFQFMDVELLQDGAAPDPVDVGAVLGVLRQVGLVGPRLALQVGDERSLAHQVAERAGLSYGDWIYDLVKSQVEDACASL